MLDLDSALLQEDCVRVRCAQLHRRLKGCWVIHSQRRRTDSHDSSSCSEVALAQVALARGGRAVEECKKGSLRKGSFTGRILRKSLENPPKILLQLDEVSLPFHTLRTLYPQESPEPLQLFGDRESATKKLCDKDFAERSGELSGAICLQTLVLLSNDRQPLGFFRKFFGAVRVIFLALWVLFGS